MSDIFLLHSLPILFPRIQKLKFITSLNKFRSCTFHAHNGAFNIKKIFFVRTHHNLPLILDLMSQLHFLLPFL